MHRMKMIVALSFAVACVAQTPKVLSVPRIEDPNLYSSFFYYHQDLINQQQAAKAANPQNSGQLDQQMATLIGVDIKDLPAVVANTQQIMKSYSDLAAERKAYNFKAAPEAGQPTARQANAEFELKRVRITIEAVRSLNQSLSAASWNGLHNYVVGTYKATVYIKH